jgi:malate dehydrogenase (oxaloacetate-decarboxylating)(NADP+)
VRLGVRLENIVMCDTKGVIYEGRTEHMNPYKARYASKTSARTLQEAMVGADVFFGLSQAACVTQDMVKGMAPNPIIFAMANPDPEITYDDALAARPDAIVATGRSDYPNQVNNVLGFPFIFRGALDVRASAINAEMKLAAVRALAALAKEDVPESVLKAYGLKQLRFGPDYLIPKPFDPRVLLWLAPAVAKAAMDTGVARKPIADLESYRESLERIMGRSREVVRLVVHKAQARRPHRVVYPDTGHERILRAARQVAEQGIATPVLCGHADAIHEKAIALGIDVGGFEIIDMKDPPHAAQYAEALHRLRHRKGLTPRQAADMVHDPTYYALMMVREQDADGFVGGLEKAYPETIRPAIQIVGLRDGVSRVSATQVLVMKDRLFFFADTVVNIDPSAEQLAEIACLTADTARFFDVEPRIAMLAFSSFGSVRHPISEKVSRAVDLVRRLRPDLVIDGEMHLETAVVEEIARENYPLSQIQGNANVLIFPDLTSGNIGYKLVERLARAESIGPILMGMRRPVNVLHTGSTVAEIVTATAITAVAAEWTEEAPAAPATARELAAVVL